MSEDQDDPEGSKAEPRFDEGEQSRLAALSYVLGAATTGKVLHLGRKGAYYEAEPDLRFPEAGSVTERLAALGYDLLGALLCERFQRVVVRGHARADGDTYALLLLPPWRYRVVELHTRFADGAWLTTTTHPGPGDDPARRILRQRLPRAGVETLEARHRAAIAARGAPTVLAPPTLVDLARALDDWVTRVDGR